MGYFYSESIHRLGRVDSDGYIYADNLQRIGRIDKDGYIYAENLSRIGRIDSVNTDESVHTARSSSACFPVFQCTLSAA